MKNNFEQSHQIEAMRRSIEAIFSDPASEMSRKLLSTTSNETLHLIYRDFSNSQTNEFYDEELFSRNPLTGAGRDQYGVLLKNMREQLRGRVALDEKEKAVLKPFRKLADAFDFSEKQDSSIIGINPSRKLATGPLLLVFFTTNVKNAQHPESDEIVYLIQVINKDEVLTYADFFKMVRDRWKIFKYIYRKKDSSTRTTEAASGAIQNLYTVNKLSTLKDNDSFEELSTRDKNFYAALNADAESKLYIKLVDNFPETVRIMIPFLHSVGDV